MKDPEPMSSAGSGYPENADFPPGIFKTFRARIIPILLFLIFSVSLPGQNSKFRPVDFSDPRYNLTVRKAIIPAVLAGYGFAGLIFNPLKDLNLKIKNEITSRVTSQFRIDDYSQYAPGAAVYGLNFLGIKGRHNLLDRSVILGTSLITMAISVNSIKLLTHSQRPDGSSYNAFPSGHTATAFACAEFLYQEYKEVSVWYGVAGYTIAAGTGFMRMYNNRHWFSDVVAGAGFGIISTKFAYWLFPKLKKLYFKDMQLSFSVMPGFSPQYQPFR